MQVLARLGVEPAPSVQLSVSPRGPTVPGKEKPCQRLESSPRHHGDHLGRGLEYEQLTGPEAGGGTLTVRVPNTRSGERDLPCPDIALPGPRANILVTAWG